MADNNWETLLAGIPLVLYPDWDDDGEVVWPRNGENVQLRDTATGQRILFFPDGKGVGITVTVPEDPVVAGRVRSVLQSQRTTLFGAVRDYENGGWRPLDEPLWRPVPASARPAVEGRNADMREQRLEELAREWSTGWRHTADDQREEIATAIVAVLRDGTGTTPDQLRISAYNNYGPTEPPHVGEVAPDRPTSRGLPPQCTDWNEFATRLEWVLTTMPWLGTIILEEQGEGPKSFVVQFYNNHGVDIECLIRDPAGPEVGELDHRMSGLGWHWAPGHLGGVDDPVWLGPSAGPRTACPSMRELAALTVTTLRDIGGFAHPSDLAFKAFSNMRGVDDMSYVGAELGSSSARLH
ncbi:hypothetical protein [Nocardia sp. NPDC050793]|uniref:TY-Chap domain-containing protein n=1 Tax=Nocardia sp. NPDC050793 TaxID=3155159 RepID=UPI0033CD3187